MATTTQERPHILIVGGGYVGLYTAFRLQRKLKPGEAATSSRATSSCRCAAS
jgi:glycine/D-amino acid oxidase-like deaminating enzyme